MGRGTMTDAVRTTCFVERDPGLALERRAFVEGIGTLLLVFAAAGGSMSMGHLLPDLPPLALLGSAAATAGALVAVIVAFGAVSGGHFNPLITSLQWLGGERSSACTIAYIAAQCCGAIAGALAANIVFGGAPDPAHATAPTWDLAASEFIATAGLMSIVFGCSRSGRAQTGPFAVAAWVAAGIVGTPSACYANPVIALGAIFAAGRIALTTSCALAYMAAELGGALLAFVIVAAAYPRASSGSAIISKASVQ